MARLKRIITDFWGLCTVCGFSVGFRWLLAVITHFRASIRAGHLQLADGVLGDGPIAVRLGNARAKLICYRVLTGIRETWVRDGYLGHGFLKIAPDALVVDLGSNMGAVTTLALAHGPAVRVFAIEADPAELPLLQRNLDLNGWADRVTIINAFIGGRTDWHQQLQTSDRCAAVPTITQEQLLNRIGRRINFLKCDIEGSEFELFSDNSPLLAASDQIAIEIHPHAGDADKLIAHLKSTGFELQTHIEPPTLTVLGRRPASIN